jgi:outer membrane protein OmpA-like peptidoglycan-associated protein
MSALVLLLAAALAQTAPEQDPADAAARTAATAEFNRGKTTRLVMNITTIVDKKSSIAGWASEIDSKDVKIADRLTRLGAKVTETAVVISLAGSILFDFDSAKIRADAERALTDVAQVIESYEGRPVRVEGHTDSMASDEYNQGLSERRAKAVADWLSKYGVDDERLTPRGFGESKPVAQNDTAAGRQKNRRVEVVIARK